MCLGNRFLESIIEK